MRPRVLSEPSDLRKPNSNSEPINLRNPKLVSGPNLLRNPYRTSESTLGRKPNELRNPKLKSEPVLSSNPQAKSEPNSLRNPVNVSEPFPNRNPTEVSEPLPLRNPYENSEPSNMRNPSPYSEPKASIRNPEKISEPTPCSNPLEKSEPTMFSNPTMISEPQGASNPESVSGFDRRRIRNLVSVFYDIQDERIRAFNRLRTVWVKEFEERHGRKPTKEEMRQIRKEFVKATGIQPRLILEFEKQIRDYIDHEIRDIPIVDVFLYPIKGIGPLISGGLISRLDPHKAPHASSFWKFMGLHVENEQAVRMEEGKKLGFNPRLRTLSWKIVDSFVKQKTPEYIEIYIDAKPKENEKLGCPVEYDEKGKAVSTHPERCPLYPDRCIAYKRIMAKAKRTEKKPKKVPCGKHVHYRAGRKMVKRFIADLWGTWRSLEKLPVSEPYAIAILGHYLNSNSREGLNCGFKE